jgi:hypothetical protein
MSDEQERKEQDVRTRSWYAVMGFGALTAGVAVIMRWMPDSPFNVPSELPNTTRLNADQLTGHAAPMLSVRPSEMGAIGGGCRVSDVALVQNWFGALRQTTLQSVEVYLDQQRARGRRAEPAGWSGRAAGEDSAGDGSPPPGCLVEFAVRDARGERRAVWAVSEDRAAVTPANALAREISALAPGLRRR